MAGPGPLDTPNGKGRDARACPSRRRGPRRTARGCPRPGPLATIGTVVVALLSIALLAPSAASAATNGAISGQVISAGTKAPIGGIEVCATETAGGFGGCTTTNESGDYSLSELPAATYKISFAVPYEGRLNYLSQYYRGKGSSAEAETVTVTGGGTTSGIDAALQEGGQISGKVTDAASKTGVAGIEVCVPTPEELSPLRCAQTDSGGEYTLSALPTGNYEVEFELPPESHLNYLTQYYNDKTSEAEAEAVPVHAGSMTSSINAALEPGGQIAGQVTDAASKAAVAGIQVCSVPASSSGTSRCASTDSGGGYVLSGLAAGEYVVEFLRPFVSTLNYLTQYYNGKTSFGEATKVSVATGATKSEVNAAMEPGGQISGKVTDAVTKAALSGVQVCDLPVGGGSGQCVGTNSAGEYTISGLASGQYKLQFTPLLIGNYVAQYYSGKLTLAEAEPVSATAGSTTTNVNAALQPGATISGVVTDATTKKPVGGIEVCTLPSKTELSKQCATSQESGEYAVSRLAAGQYKVEFAPPWAADSLNYLTQYYSGKLTLAEAEPVSLTAGGSATAIDAALEAAGHISGKVTSAATKAPIGGTDVCPLTTSGEFIEARCAFTNSGGEYTIGGLATGEYEVEFVGGGPNQYRPQYYHGQATWTTANKVPVTSGSNTGSIDAELLESGKISGTVTDALSKAAVAGIQVCAYVASNGLTGPCTTTATNGTYTLTGLANAEYKVGFSPGFESQLNYLSQYYNGKNTLAEATGVPVSEGTTAGNVNSSLSPGGKISGKVTSALTGSPVAGIEVCALPASTEGTERCALSGASGEYTIVGLPTGSYQVEFFPGLESSISYLTQYYSNVASLPEAKSVAVTAGSEAAGMNAAMHVSGHIAGTVTGAATKAAVAGVTVCASATGGSAESCSETAADGAYSLGNLAAGGYTVSFRPPEGVNYLSQYYSAKSSATEADPVAIKEGETAEGINAALATGGQIEGSVESLHGHVVLPEITVCASGGAVRRCGATDSSGKYRVEGLPTGKYVVAAYGSEEVEYYNQVDSEAEATQVPVTVGSTTSGIGFALRAHGKIEGVVTAASSKQPIEGIEVCLHTEGGGTYGSCVLSGPKGVYAITGLPAGKYSVEFRSSSSLLYSSQQAYETQFYAGKAKITEAEAVEVIEGTTAGNIDAAMVAMGEIDGVVTDAVTHTAIKGVDICAQSTGGTFFDRCAISGAGGEYQVKNLPAGSYTVNFYPPEPLNYLSQYYSGKSSATEAEDVSVSAGKATSAINAALQPGGLITGRVTAAGSGKPIEGIAVCPYGVETGGSAGSCPHSGPDGSYTIPRLATGEYRVGFASPGGSLLNFITQYYNGKATLSEGQAVSVTAGQTTPEINAVMEPGGEISGKVTRIGTKGPLEKINVCPYHVKSLEHDGECVVTNANGEYVLRGLPAGQTDVEFSSYYEFFPESGKSEPAFFTQYYNGTTDEEFATPVPVEINRDTTGINAALKSTHPIVPVVQSVPTISGTPREGSPLTEHHGSWTNEPVEYAYQWLRCDSLGMSCLPIEGAGGQTYTPVAADVGQTLAVQEIATNLEGSSLPAVSQAGAVVVVAPPVDQSPPAISGRARVGETLTESHGSWINEPTGYSYQWERCNEAGESCLAIASATGQSYKLEEADRGKTVRVIETASNAGGEGEPALSLPTAKVVPEVPANVTLPKVSGAAVQGQTLTESHGSWTNEPTSYAYQWQRCSGSGTECKVISGAVEPSYVPVAADVGHELAVAETASNAGGESAPALSVPTAKVVAAVPVNISPPSISGDLRPGAVLTESHGTWTNEPSSYSYHWERCSSTGSECKPIGGAEQQAYAVEAADVGHELAVQETATNAAGPGLPATSLVTEAVVAGVPVDVSAPTISGKAEQGQTLSASPGSWTNEPTSVRYEWQRCDKAGEHCLFVGSGQTYGLGEADLGHTIRVAEIAINAGGESAPALSGVSEAVVAAVPVNTAPPAIAGVAVQGQTLTEAHGAWTNEPSSYSYQWERCSGAVCEAIKEATKQSYLLTPADVGHTIVVQETANNAAGASSPQASAPTAAVLLPVPVNTAPPTIAGKAQQGQTFTESHGSWTHEPTSYSYQWERCNVLDTTCLPIEGATHQTYVATVADIGSTLVVEETASNADGPGAPATSAPTNAVAPEAPVSVDPPTISGTPEDGQILSTAHGTWTNKPTSYLQRWQRCETGGSSCQPIPNAINSRYILTKADVGHTVEVREIASNAGGESAPAASAPSAIVSAAPLRAVAGENIDTTTGATAVFDGSGSSPAGEITGYRWEFGDGSSTEAQSTTHVYGAVGSYTATLTVSRGAETAKQSITVTVGPTPPREADVTVVNAGQQPLEGAEVLYIGPSGTRIEGKTNSTGEANLPGLPDGANTVYVYRAGYQPATGQITTKAGAGEATVTLNTGEVAEAKLESHEMTLKEIEAAGINTNDPANQNVYHFRVGLEFGGGSGGFECNVNSAGEFVGLEHCGSGGEGGGGSYICSSAGCYEHGGGGGDSWGPGQVEGHPLLYHLELAGTVTVLKQFFRVGMTVWNLSPEPFKLTGGSASLSVPAGMSLAPTASPQSATQAVADIPGRGSATTTWIVRGDQPGDYILSANYEGKLQPFNAPVDLDAQSASPLHVWGAEALGFKVQADSGALKEGVPYHVKIGITDKATVPLYNVAVKIDSSVHTHFVFQPDQRFEAKVTELTPGQTVYAPLDIVVPDAGSVGAFDPRDSVAYFVGEEAHPGEGIEAVTPPPLYTMTATSERPTLVHLHWQKPPGAQGYEVFSTPTLDTPFGETPDSLLTTPTGKSSISFLPASATDTYVPVVQGQGTQSFYAVTTLIGGRFTLDHPVVRPEFTPPTGPPGQPGPPGSAGRYVVLGDSVPYGTGLVFESADDGPSPRAYPSIVDRELGLSPLRMRPGACHLTGQNRQRYDQLAIDGAPSIANSLTGSNSECLQAVHEAVFPDEAVAAGMKQEPPALVTIQAGADDIRFSQCLKVLLFSPAPVPNEPFAKPCVTRDSHGRFHLSGKISNALNSLQTGLTETINYIHANAPHAQIALVDYYQIIPTAAADLAGSTLTCRDLRFSSQGGEWRQSIWEQAHYLQEQLNNTIFSVAGPHRNADVLKIDISDVMSVYGGHELCTPESWLFNWPIAAIGHPTERGQEQIAAAVVQACRRLPRRCIGR